MRQRKKFNKNYTKAKAWVGRWEDGQIGWGIPTCLHPYDNGVGNNFFKPKFVNGEERLVLCEVIIRPAKTKNGKIITRKASKAVIIHAD